MESNTLSDQEIRRFKNQIQLQDLGLKGQENLKNSQIAVVGAGGLGAAVLKGLASIGIGKIGIIDFSLVEESNIQRQSLYGGNDLGKLKTIITKQRLQELFPLVELIIINLKLTEDNAGRILKPFNLVVDASNDDQTSILIHDACSKLNINYIYGSVSEFKGVASSIDIRGKVSLKQVLSEKLRYFAKDEHDIHPGGIALTYEIIGTILGFEVVKMLNSPSKSLIGKILTFDGSGYEMNIKPL